MKLVQRDERLIVYSGNSIVGYVEENKLFGIDKDGYAVEIKNVERNGEIIPELKAWRNLN